MYIWIHGQLIWDAIHYTCQYEELGSVQTLRTRSNVPRPGTRELIWCQPWIYIVEQGASSAWEKVDELRTISEIVKQWWVAKCNSGNSGH